ncbi:MAG: hypothetical protein IPK79_13485 [Vampirovibrionales bacterium]|nr:hypothetical protein [Vampirovibrionales bacterium]
MNNENIPELLKKAINCWEAIREPMVDSGIVDPKGIIPHLVIDAFFLDLLAGRLLANNKQPKSPASTARAALMFLRRVCSVPRET